MKKFSHVSNFTGYMKIVYKLVTSFESNQKILDIPAGNGLLAEKLSEQGHHVVCADINDEKKEYVYADLEKKLPFPNNEFDTVICLEGLEHVINPDALIAELCRICKKGGRVIISLPNIQNMYSRLQFLCTGTFYQFSLYPRLNPKGEIIDRGHVSSLSYVQLKYLFAENNAKLIKVTGSKYKKKILLPFLLPFILIGALWVRSKKFRKRWYDSMISNYPKELFNKNLLFSRSLIMVFELDETGDAS
ncbi:MAG: class I SAM-dependent methyltransferase [Candidatus Latescibacteria bacterium]|nr:class I SAM-dependent methyltransferase [Candidatus Latescibacterota bacterium]